MFLPRKVSSVMYDPDTDIFKGGNLLILASEDFTDISYLRVGPEEPLYGFSSLKKIPGCGNFDIIFGAVSDAIYTTLTRACVHMLYTSCPCPLGR